MIIQFFINLWNYFCFVYSVHCNIQALNSFARLIAQFSSLMDNSSLLQITPQKISIAPILEKMQILAVTSFLDLIATSSSATTFWDSVLPRFINIFTTFNLWLLIDG